MRTEGAEVNDMSHNAIGAPLVVIFVGVILWAVGVSYSGLVILIGALFLFWNMIMSQIGRGS